MPDGSPSRRPQIVSPDEAPALILQILAERTTEPIVVGITGRVGSGKSTLARKIAELRGSGVVLTTDDYLPDYAAIAPEHRDDPAYAALDHLAENLQQLRSDGQAQIPCWSFHTHRREGSRTVIADGFVICEGIHALHPSVASAYDLRVFVQADTKTRWSRWEAIEQAGERGWGVEKARVHFEQIAEPTFERYEASYRDAADVIVFHD